jgi:hypothetical protein
MKKKTSMKSRKTVLEKKPASDILRSKFTPLASGSRNGELTVDFNQYIVVYSNNVAGNQESMWGAGGTTIACYKDGTFVGDIVFYETHENLNGGYIDANGVVVLEYPIGRFEEVLQILKTFSSLSLLFVERDNQGVLLAHPVGAIMMFANRPIGQS